MYYSGNTIVVKNSSGEEIPAYSFAKLISGVFEVTKPDADNLKFVDLVIVPEAIPNGKKGVVFIGGIFVVKKTAGETIAAGDKVGSDENEWTAIKISDDSLGNNDGQFYVLGVFGESSEYLIIRPRVMESLIAFSS